MPHYDYDKDYPFAAFITNLGKYNEGALVGEWVKFPTTAEELKKVFERIGIGAKDDFGQTYEEWFITDYDCYVDGLYDLLGEYANLDELNYLASKLDDMSQDEYERFQAAMEIGDHTGSIQELINLTENLDCYDVYPDIHDHDDLCLGAHVVNEEANGFQRRGVGLCHHHLDVGVVNDLALGNVCGLGTVIGLILFNVALDCLGIERLTVGKFDVLPQGPGDAIFIIVHVPLGSQLGNHIAVIVIGQQVLISQIQIEQQCITGCTGGIARSCNGVAVAQAKGSACLGFPGCCCAGSGRTGGAGCGGAGRAAAGSQCQSSGRDTHSLEEVPTRDSFHSGFSFLSFLFLRSSARFCVCRAFVVFSLAHRELFQLPKNRN